MRRHEPPDAHPRGLFRSTAFGGEIESTFRLEECADAEIASVGLRLRSRVARSATIFTLRGAAAATTGRRSALRGRMTSRTFHQQSATFLPRCEVLFPAQIGGWFAMLSRPSDTGHTPFRDIFYSDPDIEFSGPPPSCDLPRRSRFPAWQCEDRAGPVPIETSEGWLLFYHGASLASAAAMSTPSARHCWI